MFLGVFACVCVWQVKDDKVKDFIEKVNRAKNPKTFFK